MTWPLGVALVFFSACSKHSSSGSSAITTVSPTSTASGWSLSGISNGATSKNANPEFTAQVPFEGASVSIYIDSACSTLAVATATVTGGTLDLTSSKLSPDGSFSFYYIITDTSGNVTSCQSTGLSYTLDTTPTPPTLQTVPTYATSANTTFPVTSCNDSAKYLVSATAPNASNAGWAPCSTAAPIPIHLTIEGTNTLMIWGLSAAGEVSKTPTTATIIRDTIPPPAPSAWAMPTPTPSSISNNSEPFIQGTATENSDTIKLYTGSSCSAGTLIATTSTAGGTFTFSNFTLANDGLTTFYYVISDPAGNTLPCTSTGLSYTLDTTAPTNTSIVINGGLPATNFRPVSVALAATETVSLPMQMCVAEDTDCSTCSWTPYSATKNITLSQTPATKTISGRFRDSLRNTSACIHSTVNLMALAVAPRYTPAPNWNDYVESGNLLQACNGTEASSNACIHGGEARRVTTALNSCSGATVTDTLSAFKWSCSLVSGNAVFDSSLATGVGLSQLVNASSWKANSVVLAYASQAATSAAASWWSNTVQPLPANTGGPVTSLSSSGTIYTLSASTQSGGYNITASKIGIVTLGGSILSWNGGVAGAGDNCSSDDGTVNSPDSRCILSAGSQNFLWIEGAFDGGASNPPDYGIFLSSVLFSKLRNVESNNQLGSGIRLDLSSNYNLLSQISVSNNAGSNTNAGIVLSASSQGNALSNINASNNATYGILLDSANSNSLTQIAANSNAIAGIYLRSSTSNNIGALTANQNGNYGIYLHSASSNIFTNTVTVNNTTGINAISSSNFNTFAQAATTNNSIGVLINASSNNKFTSGLLVGSNNVGNCSVTGSGTNPGVVTNTCTTSGTSGSSTYPTGTLSNAVLVAALDSTNAFYGKASSDSANTAGGASGTASYGVAIDWNHFSNWMRNWGIDGSTFPDSSARGRCSSGTCRIWDWSLSASNTVLLGDTGDGVSQNDPASLSNCPSQVAGSHLTTDESGSYTFLQNAVEIPGTGGNNDGLCQSGETCLYTPNFGAYQGHGTLQTCVFDAGTITGVTMYYYSTNGR